MKLFTAYDPDTDTQFLIRLNSDGSGEFATRPGRDRRDITWSAPIPMRAEATS